MKKGNFLRGAISLLLLLTIQIGVATASDGPVATTVLKSNVVYWEPFVNYDKLVLTVSGGNAYLRQEFQAGESPVFDLYDQNGNPFPNSVCNYELTVVPFVDPALRELMTHARESGDYSILENNPLASTLPQEKLSQSGHFRIQNGYVVTETLEEEPYTSDQKIDSTNQTSIDSPKDQVIFDDLIVVGSICAGQDCSNGESFGFDTLRLKENNLRIKFQDTSNSASFPTNDWQLTANDSSNGGKNKFSIDDIDGGRTPFTIEASAPSNSLYVDDGGRVGFGTATPVVELHVVNGDSPTLRLQQDGSAGFTPQTWDVAGNETNFFVRDATNGSRIPFKILPSAPTNSLFIAADGDVGLGTASPANKFHIENTGGEVLDDFIVTSDGNVGIGITNPSSPLHAVRTDATTWPPKSLAYFTNNGPLSIDLQDTVGDGSSTTWQIITNNGTLGFLRNGVTDWQFVLDGNGNLTIDGALTTAGNYYPDYVFNDDYELMALHDLHNFIKNNKHLPKIPSAEELKRNGVNMTEMQIKLLEKIEELTLYLIAQQKTIDELKARLDVVAR